jgi:hypothetical protein
MLRTARVAILLLAANAILSCGGRTNLLPGAATSGRDGSGAVDAPLSREAHPDRGALGDRSLPVDKTHVTLRVLFVGNSYTFVNDLPGTLEKVAASAPSPPDLKVSSKTAGSYTFANHYADAATVAAIGSGAWTHVVLQGQSTEPLTAPASFSKYGLLLAQKALSAGSKPVFYETWARKAGDSFYMEPSSGGSPKAMQAALHSGYADLAAKAPGLLARVGDAWERAMAQDPSLSLHQSDGSHPTEQGTYLAACVFFGTLTGRSPLEITAKPASTTDAQAKVLRAAAAYVVNPP